MIFLVGLLILGAGREPLALDLDSAVAYALANNPELKNLTMDRDKADLKISAAIGSFYPSVTAAGYYTHLSDLPRIEYGGLNIPLGQHENYSVQLSVQQVLFAWGKLYDAYRIAGIGKDIAALDLARKRQETRYSVTQAFYNMLVLRELAALTEESYNQLKFHEESVRKRYAAGLASQFELLRAQVEAANLKPRVMETENNLNLARNGFQMLLGMPLDQDFTIAGELEPDSGDYQLADLVDSALVNRAEIKNLENAERLARLNRSLIRRENLPTVVAGASYAYKKPLSITENEWGSSLTFTVGFTMPLFSGYKVLAQYRAAGLDVAQARLAIEEVRKAVTVEVKNCYFNFRTAQAMVAAARENLNQADQARAMAENRYRNGLATNLEYLDVQLAQRQAKTNYLNALKDYHTARAAIDRAVGKE
jgi:HAE1 family hydrophobic/amphiphilic exporter-1